MVMQARSAWRERAEPEISSAQPKPRPVGFRPPMPDPLVSDRVASDRQPRRLRAERPPLAMILAPVLGLAIWLGILALSI